MKISICGKGGSGKSAVTSLLANSIRDTGYQVLVIDADESNSGLHRMLGFSNPPSPILDLVGGKQEVKNVFPKNPLSKSGPVTNIMAREKVSIYSLPAENIVSKNDISLISIGKILQPLEGCACPMGVISREFLNKLSLNPRQVAVVDMEAGVEHFGRGVDTSIDDILIVVDPSYESLQIAERIHGMTEELGTKRTWAVLNKVTSNRVSSKLENELGNKGINVIGTLRHDPDIFESCLEGRYVRSKKNTEELTSIVNKLLS